VAKEITKPKVRRAAPEKKSARSDNAIIRYFQDTSTELQKVSWPTREETIRLSSIVLGALVVFTIFLGLLDFLFQQAIALLL
jgi:preprotein translocase subunit SecE